MVLMKMMKRTESLFNEITGNCDPIYSKQKPMGEWVVGWRVNGGKSCFKDCLQQSTRPV